MRPAFDHIAPYYDKTFTESSVGRAQRDVVWNYLDAFQLQDSKVLELNCGTGEDAIFLASRHNQVLATDISASMVEQVEQKIAVLKLEDSIKTMTCDIRDVGMTDDNFDAIFSNFGGINCLSPDEIKASARHLADRLNPGGRMIWVLMPKYCFAESFYLLLMGKFDKMFRRSIPGSTRVDLANGVSQETWYHNAASLGKLLKPYFKLIRIRPVGFFIPPSYMESFVSRRPRLMAALIGLEKLIHRWGLLSNASDHYLVEFGKL